MTLDIKDKLGLELEKLETMLVMLDGHFSQAREKNKALDYYNLQRNFKWYSSCLNIAFDEVKNIKKILEEAE